jgi:serine/threonine-protein kinase
MHPHLRGAHEARVRFTREAKSVARLKHPNILEIYDNSDPDSDDESFIITELLTGPTLKVFADAHPDMPAEVAACFVIEIARALGCAHEAGIVHRDVKPENVLLHEDRTVKLTDFGIAQMVDSQSFTATGQILGSPGHMAPEQIEGGHCDARSDIFSLGTVLYFLATGHLPFHGRNPHQVLKRIVDGEYAHPLRVRPTIGGRLAKIIEKALEKEPDARYQSAKELEHDLTELIHEVDIHDPSEMLARYLGDPEGTTKELHAGLIEKLIARGRAAADRGEMPVALDYFNRVLALDEGNETVLRLIERVGQRSWQKGVAVAAVVAGIVGVLAFGVFDGGSGTATPRHAANEPASLTAGTDPADAAPTVALLHDAATTRARDAGVDGGRSVGVDVRVIGPRARVSNEPRIVRFRPDPENVKIGIDGDAPRDFGSDFSQAELSPGPHRFTFVGDCCEPLEVTFDVPAGPGDPVVLARQLVYRPGQLMIRSNVPADVTILPPTGSPIRGRAWSTLNVPMGRSRTMQVRYSVTAEGYRAYTGGAGLISGEVTPADVTLVEEASGSSP